MRPILIAVVGGAGDIDRTAADKHAEKAGDQDLPPTGPNNLFMTVELGEGQRQKIECHDRPAEKCKREGKGYATTLGPVTGDLRGAIGVYLLSMPGEVPLHVHHHWVTEAGDTIFWMTSMRRRFQPLIVRFPPPHLTPFFFGVARSRISVDFGWQEISFPTIGTSSAY